MKIKLSLIAIFMGANVLAKATLTAPTGAKFKEEMKNV